MLNEMYNYKEIYGGYKRINQSYYDDYLIASIEGSTCEIINDHSEYFLKDTPFNYEGCKGIKNQILDKGVIATLKYLLNI